MAIVAARPRLSRSGVQSTEVLRPVRSALLPLVLAALPAGAANPVRVPVADLAFVERSVELSGSGDSWRKVKDGDRMSSGDRLRTGPDGVARVVLPWMTLTVSPSSRVYIPADTVLSLVLEDGRIATLSDAEMIKIVTPEARVRGRGQVVIRREAEVTFVTSLTASLRVEVGERTVDLDPGQGLAVRAGQAPKAPVPLPEAPRVVSPGSDPVYVKAGDAVSLQWQPAGARGHVQVLPVGSDDVLLERELGPPPQSFQLPWIGTYRWRVSVRDAGGLEGRPSGEGLVCVVEK